MRIRSKQQLEDFLDEDLSWRKKEITTLLFLVKESRNHQQTVALRSGMTLVYAHWEGYLKNAAQAYLAYLVSKGLDCSLMKNNFAVLRINDQYPSSIPKSFVHKTSVIELAQNESGEHFSIDPERAIDTGFNLKSEVLKEIIAKVGFDYSPYELKEQLIDSKLLMYRNKIAHGEKSYDIDDLTVSFMDIKEEVIVMLELFKSQILVAVENSEYLVPATTPQ